MTLFQPGDEILDAAQVCEVLGVTKAQLGRLAVAGVLRPVVLMVTNKGGKLGTTLYRRVEVENVQALYSETSTVVQLAARYGRTMEEVQTVLDRYAAMEYFDDPIGRVKRYRARGLVWQQICAVNGWGPTDASQDR